MSDESLKEKISKLLAMSESDNEHEAGIALSMAQDLMDRYHISIEEIGLGDCEGISEGEPIMSAGRIPDWKSLLINDIANFNGCRIIKRLGTGAKGKRGSTLAIYGRPSDIEAVRFLVTFAILQITRFAPKNLAINQRKSWYFGAVEGFRMKMESAKIKSTSLMRREESMDEFMDQEVPGQKQVTTKSDIDLALYGAGIRSGVAMNTSSTEALS